MVDRRQGSTRRRWLAAAAAALALAAAGAVALRTGDHETSVVADGVVQPTTTTSAEPAPPGESPTTSPTTSTHAPFDSSAQAPLGTAVRLEVYNRCITANGSPRYFPLTPTPRQQDTWRKAHAACVDFHNPYPPPQAGGFDGCLAANGVARGFAGPWPLPPVPAEVAIRARLACLDVESPFGPDSYVDCLVRNGAPVDLGVPVAGLDDTAAFAACRGLMPAKDLRPGEVEAAEFGDCVAAFGVDANSKIPIGAILAAKIWAACGEFAPNWRRGPLEACLSEQGVILLLNVAYTDEDLLPAEQACAPYAYRGPSDQKPWLDCLAEHGIVGQVWRVVHAVDVELARVASDACASLRPATLIQTVESFGPPEYTRCLIDRAHLGFPAQVVGIDADRGRSSCYRLTDGDAGTDEATFRWQNCLVDAGLELPSDGSPPDLLHARAAFERCEDLEPR